MKKIAVLISAIVAAAAAPSAAAESYVGQMAASGETSSPCANCYYVQTADNGSSSYSFPGPGVVTQFLVRGGSLFGAGDQVSALVWRANGASWQLVGESALQPIQPSVDCGDCRYPARVTVAAGDRLGMRLVTASPANTVGDYSTPSTADRVLQVSGPVGVGSSVSGSDFPQARINIVAIWEPDADGDGYGDESQDLCPADPARNVSACSGTLVGSNLQTISVGSGGCVFFMCSYFNSAIAGGSASLPFNGVIVRWRMKGISSGENFELNSFEARGGDNYTATYPGLLLGGQIFHYNISRSAEVRIPYKTGTFLGVSAPSSYGFPILTKTGSSYNLAQPAILPNDTWPAPAYSNGELLFNADVEADADGDGFGDETQDACPIQAHTQQGCWPEISDVRVTRTKFRVNRRGRAVAVGKGTVLKFSQAAAATTTIELYKAFNGRKVGEYCRKRTNANRRKAKCRLYSKVHAFRRTLNAGAHSIRYSGLYRRQGGKRAVRPGSYVLVVKARNAEGVGSGRSGEFRVVR